MNWILVFALVAIVLLFLLRGAGSTVSAETVAALWKLNPKIIDVRTDREYQDGHLPGALNLPLATLAGEIVRHVPDKQRPILLHCASGARSAAGKTALEKLGYTNVHNLGSLSRARNLLATIP